MHLGNAFKGNLWHMGSYAFEVLDSAAITCGWLRPIFEGDSFQVVQAVKAGLVVFTLMLLIF
ncbi:conserved hypothetical protein [Ricinus communis]|uniref:Uncharacterized protein n=1 Tax=Ricinus communis TaxID=3988 RepID=B9T7E1_RICCO|nr:conserved hypothetical protein [Ricinus communis]